MAKGFFMNLTILQLSSPVASHSSGFGLQPGIVRDGLPIYSLLTTTMSEIKIIQNKFLPISAANLFLRRRVGRAVERGGLENR